MLANLSRNTLSNYKTETELRAFHAPSRPRPDQVELGSNFSSRLWLWLPVLNASRLTLLSQVECCASFTMHMLMHSLDNVSLHLRPKGSVTNPRFDKTKNSDPREGVTLHFWVSKVSNIFKFSRCGDLPRILGRIPAPQCHNNVTIF